MYKRILLATDGSPLAEHAWRHGLALAKLVGARVLGVYASPPYVPPVGFEFVPATLIPIEDYELAARESAKRYLGEISSAAKALEVTCSVRHVADSAPAEAIIAAATDAKCDLIVIGSHGFGAARQLLLGSTTTRVLAHCTVPVLVHRDPRKQRTKA